MVHVVDDSQSVGHAYENNIELAKELNECKQQISQLVLLIQELRQDGHQKAVENNLLKQQIRQLTHFKQKYNTIEKIVLDTKNQGSGPNSTRVSDLSTIPSTTLNSDIGNLSSNSNDLSNSGLGRISEEEEEERDSALEDVSSRHETLKDNTYSNSLDPPDVTSVPPLVPEYIIHTPSIWRCLDTVSDQIGSNENSRNRTNTCQESPKHNNQHDLYHSTPVQPTRLNTSSVSSKENSSSCSEEQIDVTPIEKRRHSKPTKRKAVNREVVYPNNPDPPRYNLRKRTKN